MISKEAIIWMGSWADSPDKVDQINQNSHLFQKNGFKVGLVTHYKDLSGIDTEKIDFILYDKDNSMYFSETEYFKNGFRRTLPSCSEMKLDCNGSIFVDKKVNASHQFPTMRSHVISLSTSKRYKIPAHVYFDADFYGTQSLCDKVWDEVDRLVENDLRFVGFETYSLVGGINSCFFICNPEYLSEVFTEEGVKDSKEFYRSYPNEACEDALHRVFYNDDKAIIYPGHKVTEYLGEWSKDWDTNHVGLSWIENITAKSLSAFTVNAPFLRQIDDGYTINYLFRQQLIRDLVSFSAKITLKEGGHEDVIFSDTQDLQFNNFYFWENLGEIKFDSNKTLLIETKTTCGSEVIENQYKISSDFYDLTGYYRLRHVL